MSSPFPTMAQPQAAPTSFFRSVARRGSASTPRVEGEQPLSARSSNRPAPNSARALGVHSNSGGGEDSKSGSNTARLANRSPNTHSSDGYNRRRSINISLLRSTGISGKESSSALASERTIRRAEVVADTNPGGDRYGTKREGHDLVTTNARLTHGESNANTEKRMNDMYGEMLDQLYNAKTLGQQLLATQILANLTTTDSSLVQAVLDSGVAAKLTSLLRNCENAELEGNCISILKNIASSRVEYAMSITHLKNPSVHMIVELVTAKFGRVCLKSKKDAIGLLSKLALCDRAMDEDNTILEGDEKSDSGSFEVAQLQDDRLIKSIVTFLIKILTDSDSSEWAIQAESAKAICNITAPPAVGNPKCIHVMLNHGLLGTIVDYMRMSNIIAQSCDEKDLLHTDRETKDLLTAIGQISGYTDPSVNFTNQGPRVFVSKGGVEALNDMLRDRGPMVQSAVAFVFQQLAKTTFEDILEDICSTDALVILSELLRDGIEAEKEDYPDLAALNIAMAVSSLLSNLEDPMAALKEIGVDAEELGALLCAVLGLWMTNQAIGSSKRRGQTTARGDRSEMVSPGIIKVFGLDMHAQLTVAHALFMQLAALLEKMNLAHVLEEWNSALQESFAANGQSQVQSVISATREGPRKETKGEEQGGKRFFGAGEWPRYEAKVVWDVEESSDEGGSGESDAEGIKDGHNKKMRSSSRQVEQARMAQGDTDQSLKQLGITTSEEESDDDSDCGSSDDDSD